MERGKTGRTNASIIFHREIFLFYAHVHHHHHRAVCTCRPFGLRSFDLMRYDLFRRAIQAKIILQSFHFQLTQTVQAHMNTRAHTHTHMSERMRAANKRTNDQSCLADPLQLLIF